MYCWKRRGGAPTATTVSRPSGPGCRRPATRGRLQGLKPRHATSISARDHRVGCEGTQGRGWGRRGGGREVERPTVCLQSPDGSATGKGDRGRGVEECSRQVKRLKSFNTAPFQGLSGFVSSLHTLARAHEGARGGAGVQSSVGLGSPRDAANRAARPRPNQPQPAPTTHLSTRVRTQEQRIVKLRVPAQARDRAGEKGWGTCPRFFFPPGFRGSADHTSAW